MSHTKKLKETLQNEYEGKKDENYNYRQLYKQKLIDFRKNDEIAIERMDKPSNIPRAKSLGYKAKKGVFVARIKIRKGAGSFIRPSRGRKAKNLGIRKLTRVLSIQAMAEQRVSRKYPNAEVLNSYWVGEDGKNEFYEVIVVDVNSPEVKSDKNLNWLCKNKQTGRAFRGLTSRAKKGRGLMRKGKGAERVRPSKRANR